MTSRAATLERVTARAARELSFLAADAADATSTVTTLAVPGFVDPVAYTADVSRTDALVDLAVRLEGGRPGERVTLGTRVLVDE